jgi:mannosyltransferase OCH1-like enzyme
MIPKVIYQTWITKNLPIEIVNVRNRIQSLNPDYTMLLFDDNDMDDWIKNNYDENIYRCYKLLNIGAVKADLWRYLILYKNGGIYLDIDSDIVGNLDDLILENDEAIISRESNLEIYVQWCLMFAPNHPILKRVIQECITNIVKNQKNINEIDPLFLTGPRVFTEAVKNTMNTYYDVCCRDDEILNSHLNALTNEIRCRFYKIDYGEYCRFQHEYKNILYNSAGVNHWTLQLQINKMNKNKKPKNLMKFHYNT